MLVLLDLSTAIAAAAADNDIMVLQFFGQLKLNNMEKHLNRKT